MLQEILASLAYAAIAAVALVVLAWIARGAPFRGKRVGSAARDAAIASFTALQDRDRREAIEEIAYVQESWSEARPEGDDGDRTATSPDDERVTRPQ